MNCHVCDDFAPLLCTEAACTRSTCTRCAYECNSCSAVKCVDCIDECDMCSKPICKKCTNLMDTCKCCKRKMPAVAAGSFCIECVVRDWFGEDGFQCNACVDMCAEHERCKVKPIMEGQTECPICLEPFDDNRPCRMQMCDIHKVCAECDYNEHRGCPICRVGKEVSL